MRKFLIFISLFIFPFLAFSQQRPNIVFILADDLGIGDLGVYGQTKIQTPNIDKLAREGFTASRHYSGNAVCAPSRCVLMSGKHGGHSYIRGNRQAANGFGQEPIPDSTVTVAELLKKAGYQTAIIGKWGLGEPCSTGDPLKQGFDLHYGYTDQVLAHNHFPEYLWRNGKKEFLKNEVTYQDTTNWAKGRGSSSTKKVDFADELFTVEAEKYIRSQKQTPFFLYLTYIIPHDNGEAEQQNKYEAPSQRQYADKNWTKSQKDYAASVSYLDDYVGRIVAALKKQGIDKNTLLIFSSDNGAAAHKEIYQFFNSNAGLRGVKRDIYEGGIRTPFIAYWPAHIKAGAKSDAIFSFYDFLPTALELAKAPIYKNTDGISYLNVLTGKPQKQHETVYLEVHEGNDGGGQALFYKNWKLVRTGIKNKQPETFKLYDIVNDPAETTDLASQQTALVESLIQKIKTEHNASALFPTNID